MAGDVHVHDNSNEMLRKTRQHNTTGRQSNKRNTTQLQLKQSISKEKRTASGTCTCTCIWVACVWQVEYDICTNAFCSRTQSLNGLASVYIPMSFPVTQIMCCPFQYLTMFRACRVLMMSSAVILVRLLQERSICRSIQIDSQTHSNTFMFIYFW